MPPPDVVLQRAASWPAARTGRLIAPRSAASAASATWVSARPAMVRPRTRASASCRSGPTTSASISSRACRSASHVAVGEGHVVAQVREAERLPQRVRLGAVEPDELGRPRRRSGAAARRGGLGEVVRFRLRGHGADVRGSLTVTWDAVLLVSFGGPEGPDDVLPFLRHRHRGPRHPRRAARRGGGALPALRRRLADQRPEPRAARPAARGAAAAGLLGQPQLGPLPRRRAAADARRRRAARARVRHLGVLVLVGLPAVPRPTSPGRSSRSARARRGSTRSARSTTTRPSSTAS